MQIKSLCFWMGLAIAQSSMAASVVIGDMPNPVQYVVWDSSQDDAQQWRTGTLTYPTWSVIIGTNARVIAKPDTNLTDFPGPWVTVVGSGAQAYLYGTAVGANAIAYGKSSVALGFGSFAEEDNTVSFGTGTNINFGQYYRGPYGPTTRRLVNVSPGINPNDAVVVQQLSAYAKADGSNLNVPTWQQALGISSMLQTLTEHTQQYQALSTSKANTDASNLTQANKTQWKAALGVTELETTQADLQTKQKALADDLSATQTLNASLKNASGLSDSDVQAWKSKLNVSSLAASSAGAANLDGSNLSQPDVEAWKTKLGIDALEKTSAANTKTLDDHTTRLDNLESDRVKIDASNLTNATDIEAWKTKLGVAELERAVSGKANADGSNLQVDNWKAALGVDTLTKNVKDTKTQLEDLTTTAAGKADSNAANLTEDDVQAWKTKLGVTNQGEDYLKKDLSNLDPAAVEALKKASGVGDLDKDVQALEAQLQQTRDRVNQMDRDLKAGLASAVAMAGLPQATTAGTTVISGATGFYRSGRGFAFGISHVDTTNRFVIKATTALNNQSHVAGSLGAGVIF